MIYKLSRYLLPSFKTTGILAQEMNFKIDFQEDGRGRHLWFPIWTIWTIFDRQLTLILPTKSAGLS